MATPHSTSDLAQTLTEIEIQQRLEALFRVLSEYSVVSVVDVAMKILALPAKDQLDDLGRLPGITLLLVQLACRNRAASQCLGASLPGIMFDELREELWNLTGAASLKGPSLQASLRSYLPAQIEFQVDRRGSTIRWAFLLKNDENSDAAKQMFEEVIGMTPAMFIDAAVTLARFTGLPARTLPPSSFDSFPEAVRPAVLKIIKMLTRNLLELRLELQKEVGERPNKWELYQIPFAAKFPFLEIDQEALFIWHPRMLNRALEGFLHYQLMQAKGELYLRIFTRKFEQYVTQLCREIHPSQISEEAWQLKMGKQGSAVESILGFEGTNVFVEAKMAYNRDVTILEEEPSKLLSRLERVTDALYQARRVSQRLRRESERYPKRAAAIEEFAIIVTSRELYIGHGERLEKLLPPGSIDFDDIGVNARLPLRNVLVVSIDDFELLQAGVRRGDIDLLPFLREVATRNSDPITAAFFLFDHLREKLGKNHQLPVDLENELKAADNKVLSMFKAQLQELKA